MQSLFQDETRSIEAELGASLKAWLKQNLTEREFKVIACSYGLFGFPLLTTALFESRYGITKDVLDPVKATAYEKLLKNRLSEQRVVAVPSSWGVGVASR